jgi:hypothetical protein
MIESGPINAGAIANPCENPEAFLNSVSNWPGMMQDGPLTYEVIFDPAHPTEDMPTLTPTISPVI